MKNNIMITMPKSRLHKWWNNDFAYAAKRVPRTVHQPTYFTQQDI